MGGPIREPDTTRAVRPLSLLILRAAAHILAIICRLGAAGCSVACRSLLEASSLMARLRTVRVHQAKALTTHSANPNGGLLSRPSPHRCAAHCPVHPTGLPNQWVID
jgi:hypothetical protein